MSRLLSVDGLPYRLLSGWVGLVRAGLVWLLLSLPIVTAPAATTVLIRSVDAVVSGRTAPSLGESVRQVRERLVPALLLALVLVLGSAITVSAVLGPSPGGTWDVLLPVLILPVGVTWVLVCQWCFVLLEEVAGRVREALRRSYLRAVRRPDLAVLCAVGTAALPVIGLNLPAGFRLPYWLTVPALWSLLASVTCRRAALGSSGNVPQR